MTHLAELLVEALITLFAGMAPERPLWLRRMVQTVWILLGAVVLVAWVCGVVLLVLTLS